MFNYSDDIKGTKFMLLVCRCLGNAEGECLDLISDVSTLEIKTTSVA